MMRMPLSYMRSSSFATTPPPSPRRLASPPTCIHYDIMIKLFLQRICAKVGDATTDDPYGFEDEPRCLEEYAQPFSSDDEGN